VVTFLFTDIEGSTRRWEADAAAMRAALLEHDEVLRDAIESQGCYPGTASDGLERLVAPKVSSLAED
jgi:class 3 adenylate cyclase